MKILIDGQTLSTPEVNRGIGVVFKRICEELVLKALSIDWLITVKDISDLRHFSSAVQAKLTAVTVREALIQDTYLKQTQLYSQILQKVISDYNIDAYWVPNPLMMNVVLPTELHNVTIFTTIYDLIPIVMSHYYISNWPENLRIEYQRRIEKLPAWTNKLIFISENSKNDFEIKDHRVTDKSIVIPLAVDHTIFWSSIAPRDKSKDPYILFTGGFDPRKNMNAALEAFAYLIKENNQEFSNLKLYIVCAYNQEDKENYEKLADKFGVKDKLILTGYINDEYLVNLYRGAKVFFFPSHYEGFGLPVLEALACGLPIVTTKISSIPEVAGDLAYYCSPTNPRDMAVVLAKALRDSINNQSRKKESIQRAQEFTWSKTAASYFHLFTNTILANSKLADIERYKIAYVSPWPPQRSGIANYSFEIVRHLKEYVDITLFLENSEQSSSDNLGLSVKNISALAEEQAKYDSIIYHIGNNTKFHKEIYRMAWQYPGIIVLHEFNIHPFLADAFLGTDDEYLYADAISEGYGELGKTSYEAVKSKGVSPEIWHFPMSHALVKRSIATIVHSSWVKEKLQDISNVFVVPLGSNKPKLLNSLNDYTSLKKRFCIPENNFIISCFGFINKLKRIPVILESLKILKDKGYPVHLLLGGELIDSSMNIEEKIECLGVKNNVTISGYLNDDDFQRCIIMSDIVLNLRYPSLGESSAALMEALSYGKACITSNYQQFAEIPDSVCWKVDIGNLEIPQLVAYLEELMRNPSARQQLGKNAAFFASNFSSYEIGAKLYATIINKSIKIKY